MDAGNNDFHLQCGSPCINTGTNANLPSDSFDLFQDGNPGDSDLNPDLDTLLRTVGTTDMGAYEKPGPFCVGNIDNTGGSANQVNIDDLLALISA